MRALKIIGLSIVFLVFVSISTSSFGADKEVAYLSMGDYTGPSANTGIPCDSGCEDGFKYINDKGGIQGVKVKFIPVDTRYEVARAVSAYKQLRKTPNLLVVGCPGTAVGKGIAPLANADKLVQLAVADGEFVANVSRTFIWGQCYQDVFGSMLDWMVKDWKQKGKAGSPTVGYISWDNAYGREALRGGKEYAEKIGVKLLPPKLFPAGTPDHSQYLAFLKDADYIFAGTPDPTPAAVIRDAYRLGMTKNIQFFCDTFGPTMSGGVKAYNTELQGTIVVSWFLRGLEARNHPLAKELWTKYRKRPMSEMSPLYQVGIVFSLNYAAALEIALKEVGYDKLTPDDMYKAYQKLTGRNISQGMQGLCAYSPTSRRGSEEVKFYQVKGEALVPISGWTKCPDTVSLHKF
jgi:ABC-type branched-subunit amino acid transport system substrate-binding protein